MYMETKIQSKKPTLFLHINVMSNVQIIYWIYTIRMTKLFDFVSLYSLYILFCKAISSTMKMGETRKIIYGRV